MLTTIYRCLQSVLHETGKHDCFCVHPSLRPPQNTASTAPLPGIHYTALEPQKLFLDSLCICSLRIEIQLKVKQNLISLFWRKRLTLTYPQTFSLRNVTQLRKADFFNQTFKDFSYIYDVYFMFNTFRVMISKHTISKRLSVQLISMVFFNFSSDWYSPNIVRLYSDVSCCTDFLMTWVWEQESKGEWISQLALSEFKQIIVQFNNEENSCQKTRKSYRYDLRLQFVVYLISVAPTEVENYIQEKGRNIVQKMFAKETVERKYSWNRWWK